MKRLWETFLDKSSDTRLLLDIYLQLRLHFKELGFTEKDLEKPPIYTKEMLGLFHRYQDTQKALLENVNNYGFRVSWNEFIEYFKPKMKKIDELTPLENGNN